MLTSLTSPSLARFLWGLRSAVLRCKRGHPLLAMSSPVARLAPASPRRSFASDATAQRGVADASEEETTSAFQVPASHITPLLTPGDFYATLVAGVRSARRRVTLSSLYIGTGPLEQALVQAMIEAGQSSPGLELAVQLDYCRALRDLGPGAAAPASASAPASPAPSLSGSNGGPLPASSKASPYRSSCHLLMELLHQVPRAAARVHCGLTLLPQLRPGAGVGGVGRFLPQRFIEGAGVLHIKAYAWDDCVLLSGANLASDYFTNRQDRYLLIRDAPALARYVHDFVRDLGQLPGSHVLRPDGLLDVVGEAGMPPRRMLAFEDAVERGAVTLNAAALPAPVGGRWGTAALVLPPADPAAAAAATGQPDSGATCCYTSVVGSHMSPEEQVSDAGARPARRLPPPRRATARLHAQYRAALTALLRRYNGGAALYAGTPAAAAAASTAPLALVRPFLQFGLLGVRDDERNTLRVLSSLGAAGDAGGGRHQECHIATGYFNMPASYIQALVGAAHPRSSVNVLTASPAANGFLGSRGLSGGIPMLYTIIEKRFYAAVAAGGRLQQAHQKQLESSGGSAAAARSAPGIGLYEYARRGWTFHAKGLWWFGDAGTEPRGVALPPAPPSPAGAPSPSWCLTLVGSPNYGRRSLNRDVELQFQVTCRDPAVMVQLAQERDALFGVPAHSPAVVQAVGPHLGAGADPWANDASRRLAGWLSWSHGRWITAAAVLLGPLF